MPVQPPQVFISYQRTDGDFAREIREHLVAHGVQTWMDQFDIPVGAYWPDEIDKGLNASQIVIGVLSPDAIGSRNVKNEWDWAIANGKRLVLLQIQPCNVPHRYISINFIDATPSSVADALQALMMTLGIERGPSGGVAQNDARVLHRRREARQPERRFPDDPQVVGREREQAVLRRTLDDLAGGHGTPVLIGGDAGIGKTTLTRWLGWLAEEQGAQVLTGGCYDLSITPPYGPWLEILREWTARGMLPDLPGALTDPSSLAHLGSQAALFTMLVDVLSDATVSQPVMLLLEDLHWADQASLDLLRFLARRMAGNRLLVVGTYRTDELHRRHPLYHLLPSLGREAETTRIELGRLDDVAVHTLVRQTYGLSESDHERLVHYIQRHAEGHALFVSELLRALEEESVLTLAEADTWVLGDLTRARVPHRIREVIDARVARLPEDVQTALAIAAVIGQDVAVDVWVQLSGASEERFIDTIEQAVAARLLAMSSNGTSVRFEHALIRESLYENVLPLRRRLWHRRTGEILEEASNPDPDAVAHHYQQAGDPRAFQWLVHAGDRAQGAYALTTAMERFESAAQLAELDPARIRERAWLLYRIGRLLRMFDPRRGLSYMEVARALSAEARDPLLTAFATFDTGNLHGWDGATGSAMEWMRSGIGLLSSIARHDLEADPAVLLWIADSVNPKSVPGLLNLMGIENAADIRIGTLAFYAVCAGRIDDGLRIAEPLIQRLESADRSDALGASYSDACHALALAYAYRSQPLEARSRFRDTLQAQYGLGYHHQAAFNRAGGLAYLILPYHTLDLGLRREIEEQIDADLRRAGTESQRDFVLSSLLLLEGRWSEMDAAIQELKANPVHPTWIVFGGYGFAVLQAMGETDVLDRAARHFFPNGPHTDPGGHSYYTLTFLLVLLAQGALDRSDLDTAHSWIEAYARWLDWAGNNRDRTQAALLWGQYHRATGDLDAARMWAEQSLHCASEPRQPLAEFAALRLLGELDTAIGDSEAALHTLNQSLALATACLAPFERAQTLLVMAALHIAMNDGNEARRLLAEVRSICEPLGARPTLERVATLEHQLGSAT